MIELLSTTFSVMDFITGIVGLAAGFFLAYTKKLADTRARKDSLSTEQLIQETITKTVEKAKIDVIQDNIQTVITQQRAQKIAIDEITQNFWEKQQWHQKKQVKLEEMLEVTVEVLDIYTSSLPRTIDAAIDNPQSIRLQLFKMMSIQQMYLPEIKDEFNSFCSAWRNMSKSLERFKKIESPQFKITCTFSENGEKLEPNDPRYVDAKDRQEKKKQQQLNQHSLDYETNFQEATKALTELCAAICNTASEMNPEHVV
ncbi:hypothetical protein AB3D11_003719 [Vibrio vulnificus]